MTTLKTNGHYIDPKKLGEAILNIPKDKIIIVIAPTGTGKTKFANTYHTLTGEKAVIGEPTRLIAQNKSRDMDDGTYLNCYDSENPLPKPFKEDLAYMTFEQTANLSDDEKTERTLIIDEAHRLALDNFREDNFAPVVEAFEDYGRVVLMSATIDLPVWHTTFDNIEVIEVEPMRRLSEWKIVNTSIMHTYSAETGKRTQANAPLELAHAWLHYVEDNDSIKILYIDNVEALKRIAEDRHDLNPMIVTSEESRFTRKHSPQARHLINTGLVPQGCRLVLMTMVGHEGFDIQTKAEYDIGVVMSINSGTGKTAGNVKQIFARPRKSLKTTLHLLTNNDKIYEALWTKNLNEWLGMTTDEKSQMKYRITNPEAQVNNSKKVEKVLGTVKKPTKLYLLQSNQRSYLSWAYNCVSELQEAHFSVYKDVDLGTEQFVFREEVSSKNINMEFISSHLKDRSLSRIMKYGSHTNEILLALQGKKEVPSYIGKLFAECKQDNLKAYDTLHWHNHLKEALPHNAEADGVADTIKQVEWLQNNRNLASLRVKLFETIGDGKWYFTKDIKKWLGKQNMTLLNHSTAKSLKGKGYMNVLKRLFRIEAKKKKVKGKLTQVMRIHPDIRYAGDHLQKDFMLKWHISNMNALRKTMLKVIAEREDPHNNARDIKKMEKDHESQMCTLFKTFDCIEDYFEVVDLIDARAVEDMFKEAV